MVVKKEIRKEISDSDCDVTGFCIDVPRGNICVAQSASLSYDVALWLQKEVGQRLSLVRPIKPFEWDYEGCSDDTATIWFRNENDALKFKLRWG